MKIAENVAKRVGQQAVAVAGLWLRKMGDHAEMLAENPATGEWVLLVSTQIEGQFSHIYEPSGIVAKFGPNPSDPNPVIGRCLAFGHGLTDHAQNGFCRDWKPLSEIDKHLWTREQIADWVASVEPQEEQAAVAASLEVQAV